MTDQKSEHILVIDDDPALTRVLTRALATRGFTVNAQTDFAHAIETINTLTFSYAIVDLKLAAHSGLALIPILKQRNPNIRILMLTGYSSITTAVEAMRLGAHNYLCKPASTDEIISALRDEVANPSVAITAEPPSLNRLEWEHIHRVLRDHDNNISATARALGMHRRTLQRKLSKRPVKS